MTKLYAVLSLLLTFNSFAAEIDACINGENLVTNIDARTSPYNYCAKAKKYIEAGKEFAGLYYIEGRSYPLAYIVVATNHWYNDIIEGAKRDTLSLCYMFEQIRAEGYDLTKLVSGNNSVAILIGGSETNSFLYEGDTVSIDMNNSDYCTMKEKITTYLSH